jgi:hypothetical protein
MHECILVEQRAKQKTQGVMTVATMAAPSIDVNQRGVMLVPTKGPKVATA